jgi:hypothetical protein
MRLLRLAADHRHQQGPVISTVIVTTVTRSRLRRSLPSRRQVTTSLIERGCDPAYSPAPSILLGRAPGLGVTSEPTITPMGGDVAPWCEVMSYTWMIHD